MEFSGEFLQFWTAYPRRIKKRTAYQAFIKARTEASLEQLLAGVARYKKWLAQKDKTTWRPEPQYPATWLNAGSWEDEYEDPEPTREKFMTTTEHREAMFRKTGLWPQSWGDKPTAH